MQRHDLSAAELDKIHADIVNLMAETRRLNAAPPMLNAEAGKFTRETFWYPMAVVTGLYGAMAVIMAVIYKLLH